MTFDPLRRRVKDEMSTNVVSIAATDPLETAIDRMDEHSLSALPVVDAEGRCIGIITATDVARSARGTVVHLKALRESVGAERQSLLSELAQNGMANQTVHDAMRYKLKFVHEDTTIANAGSKMLWSRFHHLPVVDHDQKLVGIVSTLDILAAFVKQTRTEDDSRDVTHCDVSEHAEPDDDRAIAETLFDAPPPHDPD